MDYIIIRVRDHFEVRDRDGNFLLSADSYHEACKEVRLLLAA